MASGIQSVRCFVAPGPVQTCDRCNAAIRHVALVTWKDGTSRRFGSECINKILKGDTSLRRLFEKNRKMAERYAHWLDVLRREPEQMPRGHEYYGSGLFFIADDNGTEIMGNGRSQFHPLPDWDKNQGGDRYVQSGSPEEYRMARGVEIARMVEWLEKESHRIAVFLARVVAKYGAAVIELERTA